MKLRRWRAALGLTMMDGAKTLRLDQGTLSRLEAGKRRASLSLLLQIERLTDGQVRAEDVPMSRDTRRALGHLRGSSDAQPDTAPAA
jgi:transcriptional regulator with XRE-family HTH domain